MSLCRQIALWVARINLVAPAVGGDGVVLVEDDAGLDADGVAGVQTLVGLQLEGDGTLAHVGRVVHG